MTRLDSGNRPLSLLSSADSVWRGRNTLCVVGLGALQMLS